jgi:hypothetical protein
MSFKTALRGRILAWPGVAEIIGDRLDWVITPQPQRAVFPRGVLTVVSDLHLEDYAGPSQVRRSRVQIDYYDDDPGQARLESIVTLTKAAIVPPITFGGVQFQRTFIDTVRDLSADSGTGFVFRQSIDALFTHDG